MANFWTDTSPKKLYGWQISIWKDAPYHVSSGKWKLKQLIERCSTHLLEKLKPKTQTPNAGENVEQQEPSFIAGGNAKWYGHFKRQFGSFLQN